MLLTLLMLAAGAGAVVGLVNMKQGQSWGKPVVISCAILATLLAIQNTRQRMGNKGKNDREIAAIKARGIAYQITSGQKLGQELAQKYPGAKAVVLRSIQINDIDPDADSLSDRSFTQRLDGLKAGLGDAIGILEVMHPPVDDSLRKNYEAAKQSYLAETGEKKVSDDFYRYYWDYYHTLSDVETFNRLTQDIPSQATMAIVLADFPFELEKLDLWKKDLIVAGIIQSVGKKMDKAIEAGYISDLVISNPYGDCKSVDLPRDIDERFNRRFLYITPKNIKEIAAENLIVFPD